MNVRKCDYFKLRTNAGEVKAEERKHSKRQQ
jgi:hypothetical protein